MKTIITIACILLPYYGLAVNDNNKDNDVSINDTIKLHTNSNTNVSNAYLEITDKIYSLRPNDIIISIAETRISPTIPVPPRPFDYYRIDNYKSNQEKSFADFTLRSKKVGIVSAVGNQVTTYKVGDRVDIKKLSENYQTPVDYNDDMQAFFNYHAESNKIINNNLDEVNSTTYFNTATPKTGWELLMYDSFDEDSLVD